MLRTLLLAAFLAPLAGCPAPEETAPGPGEPVIGPDGGASADTPAARDDLEAARERWADAALEAYEMTLQRICFCPTPDYTGPFEVTVRDGKLASVVLNGAEVDDERGITVEGLFALIEEAYDRDAASVVVEYDERMGHPTSLSIDYDVRMADEEIGYRVSDLTALGG